MEKQRTSKAMNITLWIAQVLLSITFIWAGSMKLLQAAEMWPWTVENPSLAKVTGVLDILAGLGLVLPSMLRILPQLTIYAAYGTIALMVAASVFHISRGEASQIGINIFFLLVAVFIAWGRQKKAPIPPKKP